MRSWAATASPFQAESGCLTTTVRS